MKYKVVDVFTNVPFKGNPVAVVLLESPLTNEQMFTIAKWTNLSETTFVVPKTSPEADYHVRIFSPSGELPFAGHPTLGTRHAVSEWGLVDSNKNSWIQQCIRGNIEIVNSGERVHSFAIGGLTSTPVDVSQLDGCFPGLTVKGQPLCVNAGPLWIVVEVENSEKELLAVTPDWNELVRLGKHNGMAGLCVFAQRNPSNDIQMRTFDPANNVPEDPVCGSGNAAVAYYRNLLKPYKSFQGAALDRDGRIIDYRDNKIFVGGSCRTVVDGDIQI